jgi:SAM-dependent methyltransferase
MSVSQHPDVRGRQGHVEETQTFYQALDRTYRDSAHLMTRKLDLVAGQVQGGDRLLDAGCGTGEAVIRLKDRFAALVGLDSSADAVEFASSRIQPYHHISVVHGDLCELGFTSSSFDCCLVLDVLEHLADPELALAEIHRCLRREGQLIVSVPNWFDIIISGVLRYNPYHRTADTPLGWRRLLQRSGFNVLSYRAVRLPLLECDTLADKIPYLGMCILFVARKKRTLPIASSDHAVAGRCGKSSG